MKAHLAYLRYVLRHKWYVFLSCLKMRVPLYLALIHDLSKFSKREWTPYVHQFYNPDGSKCISIRDKSGAYDPAAQPIEFQRAWLSHQRNRHHWQAWVSLGDGGKITARDIPEKYIREMIADWMGAGLAQNGKATPREWYEANKDKLVLYPAARRWIEILLWEPPRGQEASRG